MNFLKNSTRRIAPLALLGSLQAFVGNQLAHRDSCLAVPFRVSKVFPGIVNHQDIDWLQIGGEFSHCPVLFLSSKNDELDKILGLAVGGDDYVTKPFSPKEIAYRVKAQLRRAEYRQAPIRDFSVKIGELMIDTDGCRVVKNGKEIGLTAREFEILRYLAENLGRVISRERLYETIWGEDSFGCDNTMMVHIRHLREKLEENPAAPKYIITMKGLGYKLVNPYEK